MWDAEYVQGKFWNFSTKIFFFQRNPAYKTDRTLENCKFTEVKILTNLFSEYKDII